MHAYGPGCRRGFTLVELLVVIAILVMLMALLLPALAGVRESGRRAACLSNLHEIGTAIYTYAQEFEGRIPYGPKAPPFISPSDFYPSTGAVTSLISLNTGQPVGLGLLLRDQLANQPQALFRPAPDQAQDANQELANVGVGQAQCSYYYRHASVSALFDNANVAGLPPDHIVLADLGDNRQGWPIRALAIDTQFQCPMNPDLASFNVTPRTYHQQKFADILYSDGHAVSCPNTAQRFTVSVMTTSDLYNAFDKILQVLELGDTEP